MTPPAEQDGFCTPADGYRGLWYGQTPLGRPYHWKYSGGLGTYPAQQGPQAVYAAAVDKTFFCWGGTPADAPHRHDSTARPIAPGALLQCVGVYDHATGRFGEPIVVFDKWCDDPHDNPVIQLDAGGHLWLFSPSHGHVTTPSFVHRTTRPHDVSRWQTVAADMNFAYPQPHYDLRDPGRGFLLLHTSYADGHRRLATTRSADGRSWSPPQLLAHAERGHYQLSHYDADRGTIWTTFDYHPPEGGLDRRSNLYVLRSDDWGGTWQTAGGEDVATPVTSAASPALVLDTAADGLLCYQKSLIVDAAGRPMVLYSTSRGPEPGPDAGPHRWWLARMTPGGWRQHVITDSDHNYDYGTLRLGTTPDGGERIELIGATEPGPQPHAAGGRIAEWHSDDGGVTWRRDRVLTPASAEVNHNFPRRPLHGVPGFQAFWCDGHGYFASSSSLWFAGSTSPARRIGS